MIKMMLNSGGGDDIKALAGYYSNNIPEIESTSGNGNPLTTVTNVPSNYPVISSQEQNASSFSIISSDISNGEIKFVTDDNETYKGQVVGVDSDTVFTYMYVISCSGYLVNATLFFTICCRRKFRRATNYLLANLCISSILFLLAVNLRIIERSHGPLWHYNEINCIVWSVFRRIPQALASLTIVAISCDRSQAARILVNRPCSTDMSKRILRIWLIAILATLPRGFLYRYIPDVETPVMAYKCSSVAVGPYGIVNFFYAFFHMMFIFMLPMCILICDIYSTIQKIVFLKSRQQAPLNHEYNADGLQNTQLHRKQLQLLRNSCLFAALFLICWLPWGIYQQLGDLPKSIVSSEFRQLIWIHFKTVRYLPFTVTAFLPLLLVVLTYDANSFGFCKKCLGSGEEGNNGENHRPNDLACGGGRIAQRIEARSHNRPRPVRLHVNSLQNHLIDQNPNENQDNNEDNV